MQIVADHVGVDPTNISYYSVLTREIEEEASSRGYLIITASSEEEGQRHDRLVDRLIEQRVDGLIIVPPHRPGRKWSDMPGVLPPLVFLDRPVPDFPADAVLSENIGGAQDAVSALAAAGARSIAFVGDALSIYTLEQRTKGYEGALHDAGLELRPELVCTDAHTDEQATRTVTRLLTRADADAIFAANNRSAIGALMAFRDAGRCTPLIGFDDFDIAALNHPAVSVVRQDVSRMGRTAAHLLIDQLNGVGPACVNHILPTSLVLRGSELL